MDAQQAVTKRLEGIIREVALRGESGKWQLRLGLEDTVMHAEFMLRPLHQGPMSDVSLLAAKQCVAEGWKRAMEVVFPNDEERTTAWLNMAQWFRSGRDVQPEHVGHYLDAIAANLRSRRTAA